MSAEPEGWARRVSSWSLAFVQVREDPRLDLELVRRVPTDGAVVMIAFGGETAAGEFRGLVPSPAEAVNPSLSPSCGPPLGREEIAGWPGDG